MPDDFKGFSEKISISLKILQEIVCMLLILFEVWFIQLFFIVTKNPALELGAIIFAAFLASSSTIYSLRRPLILPSTWVLGQITFFLCFLWHKKYLEIISTSTNADP